MQGEGRRHRLEESRRAHLTGSRRYRLTGTGTFDAIFRTGRRREGRYLQMISTAAAHDCGRVGIVIGRKTLSRAVDRNRVRRMLRVRLSEARPAIERFDLVLRLKKATPRADFHLIADEAAGLLATLTA
jgi:ribonuclease P protein component